MENPPFEDVFPIQDGGFSSQLCLELPFRVVPRFRKSWFGIRTPPKTKPAKNFQDAKDAISAAVDDDENSTWGGNFFPPCDELLQFPLDLRRGR